MTAKTLLVIGYYGDGNTGDEAVLTSMLSGISAGRQDLRFVVPAYSADPARLRETHGVDSFPFKDIGRLLDAVDEADLVVLGGGGLLHDYWDPRPETAFTAEHFGLSYYCGISWLAALLGKPVMLYGVGVGPLLFPSGRELTRDAAATAAAITVRDTASADLLREIAGDNLPIEVTADPVWQLVPASGDRLAALLEETGLAGRRFLGVAARNWNVGVDQDRWEEQLLAGIEPFAAERGLEILFLPFQHAQTGLQNDLDLARGLAARLRRVNGEVLERPVTPEELAGVLGSCEIVAGMRLHSLVFACMTGVPFVALDYDPKVRLHARLLDPPPPVLPIAELQAWSLRQALERVSRDAAAWGERGRALAAEMRRRAGRNDEIARELLDRPASVLPRSLRRPIFDFLRERAEVRASGRSGTTAGSDGSEGLRAPAWPPALANPVPLRGVSPGVRVLSPAFFDARGERVFRGGAERYLVELGKVVRGLGHSIEAFQLAEGKAWTREVDGLPVHGLPARDYTLLERAALAATGTRPELTVHLAFYTAGPDTTGPALGISHGVYWDDPGSQAPSQFRWHREHVLRAVEHLDGMVSVDTNTINWVGATSSRLAGKIVYIPNFVDLEDFRPVPRPEGARTVLLFPRRLVEARGFWLVAEILPRLLARHPDIEFHFVGDAAGAEEAEVRRLVALDPERVRWTSLPPERMPGAYQAADVVLIPTLWSEGTSLSCLEAQASGRAVIATRVGGLPDLVLPGYNGLLIEPNAAALEAAALRLIADPGLRESLAAKGLETVQGFGIERWREHWKDLLRTYLERRDDAMNDRRPHAEAGELGALRARQAELEGTLARLRAEAVEKEIRQRLLLFEQGVEFGDLKASLETARDERLEQAAAGLSSLEIRLRKLENDKRDLEAARQDLELERAGLRDQREWLLAERNDLARRLSETEGTLAYRIVSKFWRLMRTLFPEGSRRRKLYRGVRRAVARLLGAGALSPETAWTTGTGGAPSPSRPEPSPDEPPPPDFRADLIRFEDEVRASGAPLVVAIFSATQLLESEGQRPTQLALTLSRRGVPVVFVYWRWWDHEWCPQDRLEEGIVQVPIDVVTRQPEMLSGAFEGLTRILLFEFPHPGFFETVSAANSAGWITVYDVLDDWEEFHRVGQAIWYDEEFERHLITAADAVFAINEFLAGRIRDLGGSAVEIVGNGLKPGLELIRDPRPLEKGEVTVGYFGYLAGAWFDWELIAEAARRRPSWRFYLIGYGGSPEEVRLPENVALLGKQPQTDLAAYAANWDVAVIPFKPDRLAAGADPIKTYEYLAMGLPVVAAGVYPPAGGEAFVTRAEGIESFLRALEEAAKRGGEEDVEARCAFAASCTWDHRLTAMLQSIEEGRQRVAEKRALFENRR